jgi:hypothetical protein
MSASVAVALAVRNAIAAESDRNRIGRARFAHHKIMMSDEQLSCQCHNYHNSRFARYAIGKEWIAAPHGRRHSNDEPSNDCDASLPRARAVVQGSLHSRRISARA